jgi:hypothetical protein
MTTSETPTVKVARVQLTEHVQGTYPNGVSEEDLGLPTLEPTGYSIDPDDEERTSVNPDLFLGIEDEEERKEVLNYLERTRNKKASDLLDSGWSSDSKPEAEPPMTARRPRLSMCMAAVSLEVRE